MVNQHSRIKNKNYLTPMQGSVLIHLSLVCALFVVFLLKLKSQIQNNKVDFEVYEAPQVVNPKIILQPQKAKPPEETKIETSKPREVFGLTKKSITADGDSTQVEVKAGNTLAKEQDQLKMTENDVESILIPVDDYLITQQVSLLSEPKVSYPIEARKAGIEGPVVMEIIIDSQGNVREVKLIRGPGFGLNEAALDAIKKFKFRPAKVNDKAVAVKIKYTYRFELEIK